MALVMGTSSARYAVLWADLAGRGSTAIGVLLEDLENNSLYVRLRQDWDAIADEEEREVLTLLQDDLTAKAREMGAGRLFEYAEENLGASIRIADRENVLVEDFPRALNRLYRRHVQTNVVPFQTHLPRYALQ